MLKNWMYAQLKKIVFPNKGITHVKRPIQLIVSLTSHPGRIGIVEKTIDTILRQTIKPDRVVLWLEETKFPQKEVDLPKSLLRYKKFGLEIAWYPYQIRSYCKLIPQLKQTPEAIIVTADDDILYQENWLEQLYVSYCRYPKEIHCHHAFRIQLDDNNDRVNAEIVKQKGLLDDKCLALGVGGILYPPQVLSCEIFRMDLFEKWAPTTDDYWFWAMAKLKESKTRVVDGFIDNIICIDGTQEDCLTTSQASGEAKAQLENIIRLYPALRENNAFYKKS